MDRVRLSKRLAYVLRHDPGSVGLTLDPAGWVGVDDLLTALAAHGTVVSRRELDRLVASSDKQRFSYNDRGTRIRANQGHSTPVDLGYAPSAPPPVLFHGTPVRNLPAISAAGLRPGGRHAVHLSPDVATARRVGRRRGRSAVLQIDAAALHADGTEFTRSPNGVWLVAAVPPAYLTVLSSDGP
ncbi:MAG: RNA:NAD 2'-phosphotransferase [uncultured Nocardioidaceae bacterium]|uniref:Probable RNA 2'-phosphotransferase n=1 Tax=uncultured Nocardioidaceae bacterium TaxID=253824 RepID=A0A6J4M0I4_9ACTN|nr:MAG: RNA:NAD 2'-phosphotransferase [uncultured Nocardioidaceae bacterium]